MILPEIPSSLQTDSAVIASAVVGNEATWCSVLDRRGRAEPAFNVSGLLLPTAFSFCPPMSCLLSGNPRSSASIESVNLLHPVKRLHRVCRSPTPGQAPP
jgi:hypothetical protein